MAQPEQEVAAADPGAEALVAALRDYVYAYYDLRLAPEAERERTGLALGLVRAHLDEVAAPITGSSASAGGTPAPSPAKQAGKLVEYLAGHDLVLLPLGEAGGGDPGIRLVRVAMRRSGIERELPLGSVRYGLVVFSEVLIEDFPSYSGRLPKAAFRPLFVGDDLLFVDRPLLARIYQEAFLGQSARYRRLEGLWETTGGRGANPAEVKDYLRWISLRDAGLADHGSEGVDAFTEFYSAQLEVRGAAILALAGGGLDQDQVQRRALLAQMASADPRFGLADILGAAILNMPSGLKTLEDLMLAAGTPDLLELVSKDSESLRATAASALKSVIAAR